MLDWNVSWGKINNIGKKAFDSYRNEAKAELFNDKPWHLLSNDAKNFIIKEACDIVKSLNKMETYYPPIGTSRFHRDCDVYRLAFKWINEDFIDMVCDNGKYPIDFINYYFVCRYTYGPDESCVDTNGNIKHTDDLKIEMDMIVIEYMKFKCRG